MIKFKFDELKHFVVFQKDDKYVDMRTGNFTKINTHRLRPLRPLTTENAMIAVLSPEDVASLIKILECSTLKMNEQTTYISSTGGIKITFSHRLGDTYTVKANLPSYVLKTIFA